MKLNRKQRRAKGNWRRPSPTDTPAQQMSAFLKAPGKFHIVRLPDEKSFVVKVTDAEMPIFLTICQQLRGVLGFCEAVGATPVDASVANTEQVAQSSAESSKRIREARQRQEQHDRDVAIEALEHFIEPRGEDELAARRRHPAGKKRGGKHRAEEPDTVFDQLAAGADNEEGARRIAAMKLAATQDEVAAATRKLDEANRRYAEAAEHAAELNNERVIEQFAEKAGEAAAVMGRYAEAAGLTIADRADQIDETQTHIWGNNTGAQQPTTFKDIHLIPNDGKTPFDPQWTTSVGGFQISGNEAGREGVQLAEPIDDGPPLIPGIDCALGETLTYCNRCGGAQPAGHTCLRDQPTIQTRETHHVECTVPSCLWSKSSSDKGDLAVEYGRHMTTEHAADANT